MRDSPHRYDALPTATSIRLIRILPSTKDADGPREPLRCELLVTELEDAPPYDALSYTWQYPVTVSPVVDLALLLPESRRYEVICDGATIVVDYNLGYGLNMLASILEAPHMEGMLSNYIWADAISINQADDREKSTQVAQMNLIYQRAEQVVVWLGKNVAAEEEKAGLQAISVLGRLSEFGKTKSVADLQIMRRAANYKISDESTYPASGLPPLGWKDWLGVYLLLTRTYFGRLWVVQECAFAEKIIVVCGHLIAEWSHFQRAAEFLVSSNWDSQLDIYIRQHVDLYEADDAGASDDLESRMVNLRLVEQPNVWYASAEKFTDLYLFGSDDAPRVNTAVGMILATSGTSEEVSEGHLSDTLLALYCEYNTSQTTDPRDNVYALLNLAPECKSPLYNNSPLLPEYTRSARETYLETASFILAQRRDLDLLLLSQSWYGESKPVNKYDLPSWVPDFGDTSRVLSPIAPNGDSRVLDRRCPWQASGRLPWSGPYAPRKDESLELQGIRVDRIHKKAKLLDLVSVSSMLQEPLMGTNGPKLILRPRYLDYLQTLEIKGLVPDDFRSQPSFLVTQQTPFEIWWRTVLQDHSLYCFPAPDGQGKRFYEEMDAILKTFEENEPDAAGVPLLTMDDPGAPVDIGSLRNAFEEIVSGSNFNPEETTPVPKTLYSRAPYFMPRGLQLLFKTENNYLGTCNRSVEENDQIWILRGLDSPVILRPYKDGTYQLIDDVYIHGMMYGEAVEDNNAEFTTLFLR